MASVYSSSSSDWILMSCQPHRVTSGQSNSGHKQIHMSKLFSHIYQPSVKLIYKTSHKSKHKTYIHKHQTIFFEELAPSILPLLKEHVRLGVGHAGIVWSGTHKRVKKSVFTGQHRTWLKRKVFSLDNTEHAHTFGANLCFKATRHTPASPNKRG